MNRRRIFRILRWALMIYGIIGILIYYLQDNILFHPEPLAINDSFDFSRPYRELNLAFNDQSNINIIHFTLDSASRKGAVIYYHGNMKNVRYYASLTEDFLRRGYEVFILDYPGFGKSTGEFTELQCYRYAEQLYKVGRSRFSPDSLVIYGKSLGTGFATYIASKYPARQLILETPYYSFTSLTRYFFPVYPVRYMIHFKIPLYSFLEKTTMPVFAFHGTSDFTIPYSNAKKLQPLMEENDQFITIDGGGHNGLQHTKEIQDMFDVLLK